MLEFLPVKFNSEKSTVPILIPDELELQAFSDETSQKNRILKFFFPKKIPQREKKSLQKRLFAAILKKLLRRAISQCATIFTLRS